MGNIKGIAVAFNGCLVLFLWISHVILLSYADNEPPESDPQPTCYFYYTETTLSTGYHGGITNEYTMMVDYMDGTWGCDESENYILDETLSLTYSEEFAHIKQDRYTKGGALNLGNKCWVSVNIKGEKMAVEGWELRINNQITRSSRCQDTIEPGNQFRVEWYIDVKEGSYHQHQWEAWACYVQHYHGWGNCFGEQMWREGNRDVRITQADGVSWGNLRHNNCEETPLYCN